MASRVRARDSVVAADAWRAPARGLCGACVGAGANGAEPPAEHGRDLTIASAHNAAAATLPPPRVAGIADAAAPPGTVVTAMRNFFAGRSTAQPVEGAEPKPSPALHASVSSLPRPRLVSARAVEQTGARDALSDAWDRGRIAERVADTAAVRRSAPEIVADVAPGMLLAAEGAAKFGWRRESYISRAQSPLMARKPPPPPAAAAALAMAARRTAEAGAR